MLTNRKVTKGNRVITDFRHLNIRIAKNNLAYPLLKDTFSVLGSSRCELLSVLDLKDAFNSFKAFGKFQKILWNIIIFGTTSYLYQRMPMRFNISPSLHMDTSHSI